MISARSFNTDALVDSCNIELDGEWCLVATEDPQLIYEWPGRFRAGWHQFEIRFDEPIEGLPLIYFDMGGGYNELECCRVAEIEGRKVFAGIIKLPAKPIFVRLDPTNQLENVKLAEFSCARRASADMMGRGVVRLLSTLSKDPQRFVPMLKRGVQLATGRAVAGVRFAPEVDERSGLFLRWRERYDFDVERDAERYRAMIEALPRKPLLSVLMPTYNSDLALLEKAVESVRGQLYDNWELCIADDASPKDAVRKALRTYTESDPRIKVVFREANGHISEASNSALELVSGDWVCLLDHDDELRPHALAEAAFAINADPSAQIIYSDEDKIDGEGNRFEPHFKPDYSPELLGSMNYFNHLTIHRTANIRHVGGWRKGYEGSQDYDLVLRIIREIGGDVIHIPKILYHWRAVEGSTARGTGEKSYAWRAGQQALKEHLDATEPDALADVVETPGAPYYRIVRPLPDPAPRITLIIPTRDKTEILRTAIESILEKTTYPNYDILIVDNGSVETATLDYFDDVTEREPTRVRVLSYNAPFNFSAINNFAVGHTDADYVALVNNDVEVISPDWLSEMASLAFLDGVGCVGAKLFFEDDTIQHAGVIAGIGGVAGHSHKYFPRDSAGYFSRLLAPQNLSAVTAACLLVKRSIYLEVGGLNEADLTVAFNDVDFCFKVMKAGYRNAWTPFAELYHYESKSRGQEDNPKKVARFNSEVDYMKRTWGTLIRNDPYYNPNLSLSHEDFSLRNSDPMYWSD